MDANDHEHGGPEPVDEHLSAACFSAFAPAAFAPLVHAAVRTLEPTGRAAASAAIATIEEALGRIDWLARLARRARAGDDAACERILAAAAALSDASETEAASATVPAKAGRSAFNVDRVLEVVLGLAIACGSDRKQRHRLVRAWLAATRPIIAHAEALWRLARTSRELGTQEDVARACVLPGNEALEDDPAIAAIVQAIDVDGLADRTLWLDQDPLGLTQRIIGVTAAERDGERVVVLEAGPQEPFTTPRPPGYCVFRSPGGLCCDAGIVEWSATTIVAPLGEAGPGWVWLAKLDDVDPPSLSDVLRTLEGSVSAPELVPITHVHAARRPVIAKTRANRLQIEASPSIDELVLLDATGARRETGSVDADTPLTVAWRIRGTQGEDRAYLVVADKRREVALTGTIELADLLEAPTPGPDPASPSTMRVDLEVEGPGGKRVESAETTLHHTVRLAPHRVSVRPGGVTELTVSSSARGAVTVGLRTEHPQWVQLARPTFVGPSDAVSVRLERWRSSVHVQAVGLTASEPASEPVEITAESLGMRSATAMVWVERPLGAWEDGPDLGVVAVHMALLQSGHVLVFAADSGDFHDLDRGLSAVWHPTTGEVRAIEFPFTKHRNLFCSGHCMLADGRVLVVGGHTSAWGSAAKEVHTFDPRTLTWAKHRRLRNCRWYPTVMPLPDGRALIVSGSEFMYGRPTLFGWINPHAEIFDPDTNTTDHFEHAFPVPDNQAMYPHMFALPGEQLFSHFYARTTLRRPHAPPFRPDPMVFASRPDVLRTDPGYVTCVMLSMDSRETRRARIFVAGGLQTECTHYPPRGTPATSSAEIFHFDADHPEASDWSPAGELPRRRFMSDGVLLPDGTVFIVNGAGVGDHTHASEPVLHPALFDPAGSPTFTELAPVDIGRKRYYHGNALLLPDGRVAVGGHTKKFNETEPADDFGLQLFSPPYLFRGPRPTLRFAPAAISHGRSFLVFVDEIDSIDYVALVRTSSSTHQLNTDQRHFRLHELGRDRAANMLTVEAPVDRALAPPGVYLLFLLSRRNYPVGLAGGVPSIGRFVSLR